MQCAHLLLEVAAWHFCESLRNGECKRWRCALNDSRLQFERDHGRPIPFGGQSIAVAIDLQLPAQAVIRNGSGLVSPITFGTHDDFVGEFVLHLLQTLLEQFTCDFIRTRQC